MGVFCGALASAAEARKTTPLAIVNSKGRTLIGLFYPSLLTNQIYMLIRPVDAKFETGMSDNRRKRR